ncbi:MAG: cysteine desulfurase family protein [Patescibacteria group bacterium]
MKRIYLDYAATTPVDKEVLRAMSPYFSEKFGNPGSLHSYGQKAITAVDESREKIAKIIGADFREIIFTGSATEANNLAIRGLLKGIRNQELGIGENKIILQNSKFKIPRIIVSSIEHESILETCRDLERDGIEIIYLPVNRQGFIDLKKLKNSLNENTILISIMYANNEIGTIQPITKISEIIKNFRATYGSYPVFHTDATQAFQFLNCDVDKLGVDLMTLSAHKIYGPKGIGMLYVKNQNSKIKILNSIITGGGQEFGLRSGTENVPSIVGFAKAIELAEKNREREWKRITELANYFWREIKKICPKAEINGITNNELGIAPGKIKIHASRFMIQKLPSILNICFPNYDANDLLMKLDLAGVAVSSGAACSARAMKPSYVLNALGYNSKKIKNSIRISFGKFTNKKELSETIKKIKKIL